MTETKVRQQYDKLAAIYDQRWNGQVIILDWCKDYLLCRLCDFILKLVDPAYKQCYTQLEFHNFLKSAQFDIERATKFHFGAVWGMMVATATLQP
ncbi:hypothetical protein [Komarekiella delphini-convector]|uniref:hypothetical protein n=1 Tax=Komarekiella delphini-convector TaxID=3050158 RepID=UPI003D68830F